MDKNPMHLLSRKKYRYFYQVIILTCVVVLLLFPRQLDTRIPFVIFLTSVFLLPLFVKDFFQKIKMKDHVTFLFVLFLISLSISTFFSVDFERSILQLGLFICYFIVFTTIGEVFDSFQTKKRIAYVLVGVTFFLSIVSLYNTVFLRYINMESNGVSFYWRYFGHNHISALLIFAIPLCIFLLVYHAKEKYLSLIFLLFTILFFFSLFFSFGIGSSVAFLSASIACIFFLKNVVKLHKIIIFGSIILLLLTFFICVLFLTPKTSHISKYSVFSARARFTYWNQTFKQVVSDKKQLIIGTGPDTFRFVNEKLSTLSSQKTHFVHNFFLQMLSDSGLFGLIFSVALFISLFEQSIKKLLTLQGKEYFLMVIFFTGIVGSTINAFYDFDWQLPTVLFVYILISGIVACRKL